VVPTAIDKLLDQMGSPLRRAIMPLSLTRTGWPISPPRASPCRNRRACSRALKHQWAERADADRFHCHLNYKGLFEQQGAVLERARAAGIDAFLNISTRQSEWADVIATAERESDVWATVGIHPHEADEHADLGEAALLEATHHPRVIGIGETGLDYFYDHSDRQVQQDLFRTHIRVGRETGLRSSSTRNAEEDTVRILSEEMEQEAFPR
jgi:hypothetical protein